jgi:PQQ-like domain
MASRRESERFRAGGGRPRFDRWVESLPRFAVVFALVSVSVGGLAGVASAAVPGSQLWAKTYNGPANDYDSAAAVAVSPDGSKVFVAGESVGSTSGADYVTVAYDPSGSELWAKRYNGLSNGDDYHTSLAASPDGSKVFVTGTSWSSHGFDDYGTIAYDASTGARLWAKHYDGCGFCDEYAQSIAVSPDGTRVFVTGETFNADLFGEYQYATVAYDASTGTRIWARRYDGPDFGDDRGRAVTVSADGAMVFVTGTSHGTASSLDYATLAYDAATGARLWATRYNGTGNSVDAAYSIAASPDGTIIVVTGSSSGTTTSSDYATVAYDPATGEQLWAKRDNGPSNLGDGASSVVVSADGTRVFVTGSSGGSTSASDYATVGYDAVTGAKLWSKRYNGPGNGDDNAQSIAVSPDGTRVFVTGASPGTASSLDYATLAYDASTGGWLWTRRSNGAGNSDDGAHDLAAGPAGDAVFVTGYSVGSASGADFKTIAYAA